MVALTLEILEGPDAGRSIVLDGTLEIGRDPSSDLRLDDKLVSRHHARISETADGVVIEDLGSSNGTLVNDDEIAGPTYVAAGDTLLIGASVIRLSAEEPVTVAPPDFEAPPPEGAPPEAPTERTEPLGIGSELAGYRLEAVVGRGGMGLVYRAEHLRLKRKVALKVLPPELAADADFRQRFESESRLAAAIDHPNIIPLYDAGEVDGLLFLTMRLVDGLDLDALLKRDGPMAPEMAVSVVEQIGAALDAAHARGLVHRDVKPGNLLIAMGAGTPATPHCYLTDFGLSKDTFAPLGLTRAGEFVGTIDYVAPEQIQGIALDGATDQYALGCVLYQCLTGHPPFENPNELDVMQSHLSADPPAVTARRSDLPRPIDAVVARAMAKAPEDRHPSCTAMASAARAAIASRRRRLGR